MPAHKKFPALGRGLDALISTEEIDPQGSSSINEIALDKISPNPNQPRKEMDESALEDLANSIAQIGIVQPITLRQKEDGDYEIIAGERRWHAARKAGLQTIPAYVRTVSDEHMMEMALVENIQREDLNAIEIALAYANLVDSAHLTQEQVADKVGKKRTTVANYLRLLKLPAQVQLALRKGTLDQGHARALLGLANPALQIKVYQEIAQQNYSVHQVEKIVQDLNSGKSVRSGKKRISNSGKLPEEYESLKAHLSSFFNTKVQMTCSPSGKGRISIPFSNEEDLEKLIALFDRMKK